MFYRINYETLIMRNKISKCLIEIVKSLYLELLYIHNLRDSKLILRIYPLVILFKFLSHKKYKI